MSALKHTYFVSFSHSRGFGNTVIPSSSKIKSITDIKTLQKDMAEFLGVEDVIILNWQEF
jgi:hypothetical protein